MQAKAHVEELQADKTEAAGLLSELKAALQQALAEKQQLQQDAGALAAVQQELRQSREARQAIQQAADAAERSLAEQQAAGAADQQVSAKPSGRHPWKLGSLCDSGLSHRRFRRLGPSSSSTLQTLCACRASWTTSSRPTKSSAPWLSSSCRSAAAAVVAEQRHLQSVDQHPPRRKRTPRWRACSETWPSAVHATTRPSCVPASLFSCSAGYETWRVSRAAETQQLGPAV